MIRDSEFPRPFDVRPWPANGIAFEISATAAEREALAARFGLLALERLDARGRIDRAASTAVLRLTAEIEAAFVQPCVLSLEPVPGVLKESVRRLFRLSGGGQRPAAEIRVDPETDETEPIEGERIDVGEIIAEELALALPLSPRAESAETQVAEVLGPNVTLSAADHAPGAPGEPAPAAGAGV